MSDGAPSAGLAASLRGLLATLLELAQVRLELLSSDIEQEKLRLIGALMWAAVAALLAGIALTVISVVVALLFWDTHRLLALSLLALLYGLGAWAAGHQAQRRLATPRGPFGASADELGRDRALLDASRRES